MDKKSKGIEIVRQSTKEGFSIASNGMSLKTEGAFNVHFETQHGYVYLVVDCSGSMNGYKLVQAKKGSLDFAKDAIKKEYLVGLIRFDSDASHLCEPVRDMTVLESCFQSLVPGGTTNMADAIKLAHARLKRFDGNRAIVIATDGAADDDRAALTAGKLAGNDGIDIITIGTDDADQEFLQNLATRKELGSKVSRELFAKTIASASNLLAAPKRIIKK
jgi:Mg-chelatase subunit ChlD